MSFYKDKNVLVTGALGMIGKELVELLEKEGAIIKIADLKAGDDLRNFKECIRLCKGVDYIFHLMGIKGNPKKTKEKPVDFMTPMLQCDTNMIEAANLNKVKRFLYTSSIAVENPETDKYPAWAKKTAETLIEAYRIQYPELTQYCIVRPSNVYGRFDDIKNKESMVITSLIRSAWTHPHHLEIYGDGLNIRDFINAKDVARGMMKALEIMPNYPVNLCSGEGVTIKRVAEIISEILNKPIKYIPITNQIMGDNKRVMEINWDFKPEIDIEKGVKEVTKWMTGNQV